MAEQTFPDYELEHACYRSGYACVCGIDEAGRGPLAGPVFAAAVVLPPDCDIPVLNDSKKLSPKKREQLFDVILDKAISCSVASASEREIDELNILEATFLAMRRAVDGLSVRPDMALIDGNRKPGLSFPEKTVVKGDARSMSIAAASVLAKVSRDRYMLEMAQLYPEYQFEKHKGYGTKLHYQMLAQYGVSEIHRKSFLKTLDANIRRIQEAEKETTSE